MILGGCGKKMDDFTGAGYETVTQNVKIEGAGKHRILWISDLHIISLSDEIKAGSDYDAVKSRIETMFVNSKGVSSNEQWKTLPELINKSGADLVIFGGDMVDCASEANLNCLKEGLDKLTVPYIYIRADHDNRPYYLDGTDKSVCDERHNKICENGDIISYDLGDLLVVGINNSTDQMTEAGLAEVKRLFSLGKPVILAIHVPINSYLDDSLEQLSLEMHGNRVLCWGIGDYYNPDEVTKEFLNLLLAKDSPVIEIYAGHLHADWDGMITAKIHGHVFGSACFGQIGDIVIN